jgi:hypothetical protein
MNKKLIVVAAIIVAGMTALARPHGGPGPRWSGGPYHHGVQRVHHGGHYYHHGRSGWSYAAGVATGALIGGLINPAPAAVVVQQPVVTTPVVTTPVYQAPVTRVITPVNNNAVYVNGRQVISGQGVQIASPVETIYVAPPVRTWVNGYYQDVGQHGQQVWVPGHYE